MSNQLVELVELVPHPGLAFDLQADQLPAAGTADIDAFDLHGAHGLRKIRNFPVDTNFISNGKISLLHFHDNHLDL